MNDTTISKELFTRLKSHRPSDKDLADLFDIAEAIAALADDSRNSKTYRALERIHANLSALRGIIDEI
jgi:hypothetical protein